MPRRMLEHPTGRDTTYRGYEVSRTLYHILLPLARNGGYFVKSEKTNEEKALNDYASDARRNVLEFKKIVAAFCGIDEADVKINVEVKRNEPEEKR